MSAVHGRHLWLLWRAKTDGKMLLKPHAQNRPKIVCYSCPILYDDKVSRAARKSAIVHVVNAQVRPPPSMPRTVHAGPPAIVHRVCGYQRRWDAQCQP